MAGGLIATIDELQELTEPIWRGDIGRVAVDTETTEVLDDRFTPYGTETRIAGYSLSFDLAPGSEVDLYVPIRHVPYDWRRRFDLVPESWRRRLLDEEGVTREGTWAPGWNPNLPEEEAFELLEHLLGVAGVRWTAHNWGFDGPMIDVEGIEVPWDRIDETQFASVFTDTRPLDAWDDEAKRYVHGGHALKHLAETHLGVDPEEEKLLQEAKEALGPGSQLLNDYSMLPLRTVVSPYACKDTRLVLMIWEHCTARESWDDQARARYEVERRLIRRVAEMAKRGVPVDPDLCGTLGAAAEEKLAEVVVRVNKAAGRILPLGNGEKLATVLYSELGLPTHFGKSDTRQATLKMIRQKLPEGQYSADGICLRDVVDGILEYRGLHKELTAFYRPLAEYGKDGTVYPIIRQMAAVTTRMSASKPNVQQMKKKGEVRKALIARPGRVLGFADYDQVEMRIAAHYTKVLPDAFERRFTWSCTMGKRQSCKGRRPHGPKDNPEACKKFIHVGRRAEWLFKPPVLALYEGFLNDPTFDPHQRMAGFAEVDRDEAKHANFALLYGAFWKKLAETIDCTVARAEELYHLFWDTAYPELQYVRDLLAERLRRAGPPTRISGRDFIRTLKGARIYLESDYKALNMLVQRSAREVFGDGFDAVADYCEAETHGAYIPLGVVHDEIVFDVDAQSLDAGVWREITGRMSAAGAECVVPLTVGVGIGDTWHKGDRDEVALGG